MMKNVEKYTRGYFMPPVVNTDWMKKEYVKQAPNWCSVDLRDGNQALITPMSLEQKLEFFQYLVSLGFKEIEIGFPAASETEYEFTRRLIEDHLIPDDVSIQVLTQSRDHIIKRTFEALDGAKNAVVHLYNSTSAAQRQQVFRKPEEDIIEIAVSGAVRIKQYAQKAAGNYCFEYSPESFTGTEMEFALEICNRVLDVWQPTPEHKAIINLPSTVQLSMPHVYAGQIAYMSDHLNDRDSIVISVHPHNDRGCGVAEAEMALLAGADRVEGTLFGNGERTGNVDIVTLALNMYSQGVDPNLDFSNIHEIREMYERMTDMKVHQRHPYGGELVFTAFSGSHQDAITKGMKWRETEACQHWNVPYLPIDPKDIGRNYEGDIIRVNSQSGKGGIGFLLEKNYGFQLPAKMREHFGYDVKNVSDHEHKELTPREIYQIFKEDYINIENPLRVTDAHFRQMEGSIRAQVEVKTKSGTTNVEADGNGRLDAVANALRGCLGDQFSIVAYEEHALERGSTSRACAYVGVGYSKNGREEVSWGAGIDNDVIMASVRALVSAVNKQDR